MKISGLEVVKSRNPWNHYGLLLQIGNDTKIDYAKEFASTDYFDPSNESAPFEHEKQIPFGAKTKTVWTSEKGMARIYHYAGVLVSSFEDLSFSPKNIGRVIVKEVKNVEQ